MTLAPVRDTAELADVRRLTPDVYVITPEQAAGIVDQLIAMGARQTTAGRWALAWFGRVEERADKIARISPSHLRQPCAARMVPVESAGGER